MPLVTLTQAALPQNTPTIYLAVGLLALVGALAGALGTVGTAALQRRHERRLKLDEVRREAYVAMYQLLKEERELMLDYYRLAAELVAEHGDKGEEGRVLAHMLGHGPIKDLDSRISDLNARRAELTPRRDETAALFVFISSQPVQAALNDALRAVIKVRPGLAEADANSWRDAFLNSCRKELGVRGKVL